MQKKKIKKGTSEMEEEQMMEAKQAVGDMN